MRRSHERRRCLLRRRAGDASGAPLGELAALKGRGLAVEDVAAVRKRWRQRERQRHCRTKNDKSTTAVPGGSASESGAPGCVHRADAGVQHADGAVEHPLQVAAARGEGGESDTLAQQEGARCRPPAHLVTSPASLVSCCSPCRPTTACGEAGGATGVVR